MKLLTLILFTSILSSNAFAEKSMRLEILKNGCVATKTYEDEAKCFRGGTEALVNRMRLRRVILDMCLPTKTYESEAKCFRSAINTSDRSRWHELAQFCIRNTSTWKDESSCMRDALQRRRDASSEINKLDAHGLK